LVRAVSFDLFDTLVTRPFVRPTDLFRLMEQEAGRPGFADARIGAESRARRELGREITLDEIYQRLPEYGDLSDLECSMEMDLSLPNGPMISRLESFSEDHPIFITTDMYLPRSVIEGILGKHGIPYSRLYISSETGLTKHDGRLFRHILEENGLRPEELLHIGDNRRADLRVPSRMGIRTEHVPSPIERYFREHPDERRFYRRDRSLTSSIIVAMDMLTEVCGDVWKDIGRRYGGPIAYSFSKFIMDHSDPDDVLLFTARDGYSLERCLKSLCDRDSHYVYSQRILADMLCGGTVGIAVPNAMSDQVGYRRALNRMRIRLEFYRKDLGIDEVPTDGKELIQLYHDLEDRLEDLRMTKMESYSDYLKGICAGREVEMVDCTTMKLSSQRLIEEALGRTVHAHYLVVLGDRYRKADCDMLCRWPHRVIGWERVDIPEFLLCSPEMPLIGWDGGPVFADGPDFEAYRAEHYQSTSDGELEYVEAVKGIFKDHLPDLDYTVVNRWVMLSTAKGTRYRDLLKDIRWASGPDHSDWAPIVPWDGPVQAFRRLVITFIQRINETGKH
jgi:predicted HAD superfamily hydrolase